jgi:GNAT superfamily N-acetyltransferase
VPIIRAHRLDDADVIADILADGWQTAYGAFMPEDILAPRTDRATRRVEIRQFLGEEFDPRIEHLLVYEDVGIDGFVHIVLEDKANLGAAAHINLLYVIPTKYGRGIGRQLMRAAAEWLAERVDGPIVLSAYELNAYRHFYARMGGDVVMTTRVQFEGHSLGVVYYQWPNAKSMVAGAAGF